MTFDFYGLRVIPSDNLTEAGEPYQVRRSWKERLFSRPWRPLIHTRTVVPQVPMKGGMLCNGTILMHPQTIRQLRNKRDDWKLSFDPARTPEGKP